MTNAHVIENAKKIIVKLSDKREFEAKVLGKDPKTDVAVIKIDSDESLPTADLGDSEQLEVGEWVMGLMTISSKLIHRSIQETPAAR